MVVTSARERFLEALFESAVDYAIIGLDLDGLVTSWNQRAENILGWREAEMTGRPATIFFTQEDREAGVPQAEMKAA
jgi:PAS domain S-box-containing protein